MGIKLKSSKKMTNKGKSLLTAGIIIFAAAAGFMALFPSFRDRAQYFYEDSIHDSEFLNQLCKSNYVLYKGIQENVQEKKLTYQDIYVNVTQEKASEDELRQAEESGELHEEEYAQGMQDSIVMTLAEWESELLQTLYRQIDYCVMDNRSGRVLKNTDRTPEDFLLQKDAPLPYAYLICMEYDAGGNLTNVSVQGDDSDRILKTLQSLAQQSRLWEDKVFYREDGTKTTVQVKRPGEVSFVYGITQEQWQSLDTVSGVSSGYQDEGWWKQYRAYNEAGIPGYYMLFLAAVFLAALLLPKLLGWYELEQCRMARVPLEPAVAVLFVLIGLVESVVNCVIRFHNNTLYDSWNRFMPRMIQFGSVNFPGYVILKLTSTFLLPALLFLAAYWMATSMAVLWEKGLRGYLKERSLLYRFWLRTKDFWKAKWRNLKKCVLTTDLSGDTSRTIFKIVLINFIVLAALSCLWFFGIAALIVYSLTIFVLIRQNIEQIQAQYNKLLRTTHSIAQGNLNTPMEENLGVFEAYKEELGRIQEGFRNAVDEEVKSQKMKTELITNVSHDLKTPLTAIITYIDLLKEENLSRQQQLEYLATLEKKSIRLKELIEDLFEVSKADSGNVTLNMVDLDICNLVMQVYLEYQDKLEQRGLEFRFRMPEEKVIVRLDSQKTYRIFENLYTNISKYAMGHTRVYVSAEPLEDGVQIEMKNISATELNIDPAQLTERFVRGDSSRNTEGSGLGLAIASSFVQMQGGSMELEIDGDLFKVKIKWPH